MEYKTSTNRGDTKTGNGGVGNFLIAFGMGLLAGVAVGMILAPAPGSETRRKLGRFAGKMKDRTYETAEKASDFVRSQARHSFRRGED